MLTLRFIGERHPSTAVLLFAPPALWLLPAVPLGVASIVRRSGRQAMIIAAGLWLWLSGLAGFQVRMSSQSAIPTNATVLKVLTHNTGQAGKTSLQEFKDQVQPDVLLLQDAPGRARRYLATTGDRAFPFAEDVGEFTLVSRFPITKKELIASPVSFTSQKQPIAARFEVVVGTQTIVIYNVHGFTPRAFISGPSAFTSLLYGIIGFPGTRWAVTHDRIQTFWQAHCLAMQQLHDRIVAEHDPCVVAGDFNAPPLGLIHRMFTNALRDVHECCGSGSGFTFPGSSRNPLSGFGPWLRLDQVFVSHQWTCLSSVVEPSNPSQHRALAVTISLKASS